MRKLIAVLLFTLATPLFGDVKFIEDKKLAVASIEKNTPEMTNLSDEIWRYAETALKETRSSKALADYAAAKGFRVTRNVAGMPTAFVAEYGSGKPIIGIMGEFDALPGISQKAQPTKEALDAGAPGHGCGHNLFGVASLGAAIAVKNLIEAGRLQGTVKFFGTPAEEAVGGKLYMLREGTFRDVDVMLAWHPSDETVADTKSTQALVDVIVEFHGRSAHAAFDPWNGRSAVDGLEIFTHSVNMMREHIRPTSRLHYVIVDGGKVPNVVPDYAKLWIWARDNDRAEVDRLLARLRQITDGAALAANVEAKLTVQSGDWNMLVNMAGERAAWENMNWLGPLAFTEDEQQFAKTIQKETGVAQNGLVTRLKSFDANPGPPDGGSTDVADVSWNVPTIHLSVATAPLAAPWHAWPVAACGGMSIGHKGMLFASKSLASTMVDLFRDPNLVKTIKQEFAKNTEGIQYTPYIPAGPPPIP